MSWFPVSVGVSEAADSTQTSLVWVQEKKKEDIHPIRGSVNQRETERQTQVTQARLCEDKTGLVVNLENLLDGVDVRCRPQIQTQVVLVSCPHDLLWLLGEGARERK